MQYLVACKAYDNTPADRGGSSGPKGQARARMLKHRDALAEKIAYDYVSSRMK